MEHKKSGFLKPLSHVHIWALAFGYIIGWDPLINPRNKFLPNFGVEVAAIAMVLGVAIMIITAFAYASLHGPKYPKAGGEFNYTKNCIGKVTAYICGWFLLVAHLTNVYMNSTTTGLIVGGLDGSVDCTFASTPSEHVLGIGLNMDF